MKHTKNNDIKIGIQIGDRYGMPLYSTDITDPYKSFSDANDFISSNFGKEMQINFIQNSRKHRRR
jgi:hypothetical protein